MRVKILSMSMLVGLGYGTGVSPAIAQVLEAPPIHPIRTPDDARTHDLEDLRTATARSGGVPLPDLSDFLRTGPDSRRKLEELGKMLFWDQAVGSDGQSCASCHYHAGADNRSSSQISPGLLRIRDERDGAAPEIRGYHDAAAAADTTFQTRGPGEAVRRSDFPLIRNIQESGDSDALIESNGIVRMGPGNSNDVVGSIGVNHRAFSKVIHGRADDDCRAASDHVFRLKGKNSRRVPPRNSPTVINAVFNAFNFWDGRANHYFNGQNPFGVLDPTAKVLMNDGVTLRSVDIKLPNSSLASQAVGPPNSDFEMACGDSRLGNARTWFDIGKKLTRRTAAGTPMVALANQRIHPQDSLIGQYGKADGVGSTVTYREMIEQTFQPKWWRYPQGRIVMPGVDVYARPPGQEPEFTFATPSIVQATLQEMLDEAITEAAIPGLDDSSPIDADRNGAVAPKYSLMEANFSLFFGLAVQAYEATLVADDSPFDRWMRGSGEFVPGFGAAERRGLNVFAGKGKCIACHAGPELTAASVRNFQKGKNMIEPMIMGDKGLAIYDNGFYNIGVTPTVEDIGRGGKGPLGQSLASSRQLLFKQVLGIDVPHKLIGEGGVPARTAPEEGDAVVCDDIDGDGLCGTDEPLNNSFHRAAVDGAFKTPGLRNIELQGPYFHNGAYSTLAQAVEFYDNGGNFCRFNLPDLDPDITGLGLEPREKRDLVKFMVSLTDERVRYRQAPFDHPQLNIPRNGRNRPVTLLDEVGAGGSGEALGKFLDLNPLAIGKMPVDVVCSPNG